MRSAPLDEFIDDEVLPTVLSWDVKTRARNVEPFSVVPFPCTSTILPLSPSCLPWEDRNGTVPARTSGMGALLNSHTRPLAALATACRKFIIIMNSCYPTAPSFALWEQ